MCTGWVMLLIAASGQMSVPIGCFESKSRCEYAGVEASLTTPSSPDAVNPADKAALFPHVACVPAK